MNKCNNCFHRKVCIDSSNFKNAENCRQYVSEKDVQEVVRCKDCMYYYKAVECQEYYCGKAIGLVEANFDSFCSYGKKMEGDSNA